MMTIPMQTEANSSKLHTSFFESRKPPSAKPDMIDTDVLNMSDRFREKSEDCYADGKAAYQHHKANNPAIGENTFLHRASPVHRFIAHILDGHNAQ